MNDPRIVQPLKIQKNEKMDNFLNLAEVDPNIDPKNNAKKPQNNFVHFQEKDLNDLKPSNLSNYQKKFSEVCNLELEGGLCLGEGIYTI